MNISSVNRKFISALLFAAVIAVSCVGCTGSSSEVTAEQDEVLLEVTLETEDEIYMVSYDTFIDGDMVNGGETGNVNGSAITDNVYISLTEDDFPEGSDLSALSIQFYIAYTTDNAGDIESAANHDGQDIVSNELSIEAAYGNKYSIVISGGKESGYAASLAEGE